jgi:protein-tyrosine-phosphatase/predicted ATP-grasp superfamily ATP-dependent carboligase
MGVCGNPVGRKTLDEPVTLALSARWVAELSWAAVAVAERPGKVLVLGQEDRAFLAVVRSLGRRGLEVHVGWCPGDAVALRSRYVTRVHALPRYARDDDGWRRALVALLERERFDLVIPTNDTTIMPLQAHRAEFEPYARLYLPSNDAYAICFDKGVTHDFAQAHGVPVPRQLRLTLPVSPDAIPGDWYPLVLKPLASYTLDDLERKRFVRRVMRRADVGRELQYFAGARELLVQEFFQGTGVGVEMLAYEGRVLLAFQHLRVHERRGGGADSYRVSLPLRADMRDAATRMVAALGYTGVIMFEFKMNLDTGAWVLLEINGRFWASLPLCLHAGADFPFYLYQLLVEGRRSFPQEYRHGVYCRNWTRDVIWLRENLRAPHGEGVPIGTVLREFAGALRGRESSDTFVLDDPAPGVEDLRRMAARVARRLWRGGRAAVWALPPVRHALAGRSRRAFREARQILFVCKGNVCRSPFAEKYTRGVMNHGVAVRSAGYVPRPAGTCPPLGVEAARALGVDLDAHRSAPLTEGMVREADAIFVFDDEARRSLGRAYPFARGKTYPIGWLATDGPIEIRDPYGGAAEDFARTYATIRRALDAAIGPRDTPAAQPSAA